MAPYLQAHKACQQEPAMNHQIIIVLQQPIMCACFVGGHSEKLTNPFCLFQNKTVLSIFFLLCNKNKYNNHFLVLIHGREALYNILNNARVQEG